VFKRKTRKGILLITLIVFLVVGCGANNELVGTWVGDEDVSIEFFRDGTVLINSLFFSVSGTYSIVDKNRVRLDLDGFWGFAGAQVLQYSVSGNQLNLDGEIYTKSR
jgi:hypothetical protein